MTGRMMAGLLAAAMLITGSVACQHGGGSHTHIAVEQTPPAVVDGFHREFPGLKISHTDEIHMPDGTTRYDLKFRDAENHYHRKIFSADGKLEDTREGVVLPATH
ncbi:MAG TPA: hypothetical protein VM008_04260 [Phycisphaerae bacterium]|nr:hypothetical protein [Phycisphaerae bacterium]